MLQDTICTFCLKSKQCVLQTVITPQFEKTISFLCFKIQDIFIQRSNVLNLDGYFQFKFNGDLSENVALPNPNNGDDIINLVNDWERIFTDVPSIGRVRVSMNITSDET